MSILDFKITSPPVVIVPNENGPTVQEDGTLSTRHYDPMAKVKVQSYNC